MADAETPTQDTPQDAPVSLPIQAEQAQTPDEFDKDRAMATIKKLRDFETAATKQLKELEALKSAEKARKDAELSEVDRLKKELKESQEQHAIAAAQVKRATLKDAATEAALKHNLSFAQGALADAIALGLFDSLEWDDDKPKGIGAMVKELAQTRPHFFAQAGTALDIGATAKGKATKENDLSGLASRWGIKVG